MKIILNGKISNIEKEEITIDELISLKNYQNKTIAIAINGKFVPKSSYKNQQINDGDEVEIVAPMQGG